MRVSNREMKMFQGLVGNMMGKFVANGLPQILSSLKWGIRWSLIKSYRQLDGALCRKLTPTEIWDLELQMLWHPFKLFRTQIGILWNVHRQTWESMTVKVLLTLASSELKTSASKQPWWFWTKKWKCKRTLMT